MYEVWKEILSGIPYDVRILILSTLVMTIAFAIMIILSN